MKKNYLILISFLFCFAFAKAQIEVTYDTSNNTETSGDKIVTVNLQRPDPIVITQQAGSPTDVTIFNRNDGFIGITVTGGTPITDNNDNVLVNGAYNIIVTRGFNVIPNTSVNGQYDILSGEYNIGITDLASGSGPNSYTITIIDGNNCSNFINNIEIFEPEEFSFVSLDMPVTQPTCSGDTGELTIRAQGGIENYEYVLFRTQEVPGGPDIFIEHTMSTLDASEDFIVSNLDPDNYVLVVTDNNGARIRHTFTVDEIAPILFTIGTPNNACNGELNGSINVTMVSGGNGVYSFSWNLNGNEVSIDQNLTGVGAGLYILTVTDSNGCEDVIDGLDEIGEIVELTPVLVALENGGIQNPTGENLSDGFINVDVSGGVPPYGYSWTEGGVEVSTNEDLENEGEGMYTLTVTDANMCTTTFTRTLTDPEPLSVVISTTVLITCNGDTGTLVANGMGGSGSYTYQWFDITDGANTNLGITTNTASGLAPGDYRVIIADIINNAITAQDESTLADIPALSFSNILSSDVLCNGGNNGSASVEVSGGNNSYTYSWSKQGDASFSADTQSISNVTAGTYIIRVEDAIAVAGGVDCSITTSIVINEPSTPLTITNFNETNILINGQNTGAINITVSGGTPSYEYSWTKDGDATFTEDTEDLTNLFAGTYTVTITDAIFYNGSGNEGCTVIQSFTITEEDALIINITETGEILCNGETTSLLSSVSGGVTPYTYQWSQEISGVFTVLSTASATDPELLNIQAGTYQIQVTDDNGAIRTEDFTIAVVPDIVISNIISEEVKCAGELTGSITVNVTGGTGALSYVWTDEMGTTVGTMQNLSNVGGGAYSLSVTDENGCPKSIGPIEIEDNFTSLIIQEDALENLDGFETNDGLIDISVTGGASPYSYIWSKDGDATFNETTQDVSALTEGTYTVIVEDDNECTIDRTFIITQPELLEIVSITETNSNLCFEDSTADLEAMVTGGIEGTYTFSWFLNTNPSDILSITNMLSNQPAGIYTLIVTDVNNNTSEDTNIVVNEASEIMITGVTTDILCNGEMTGVIDISVIGGTPRASGNEPYFYSWSNGATTEDLTGIIAGTYTINITDGNNCQSSMSFNIAAAPPLLEIDTSLITNTSGFELSDGAVSVAIIGGMPPYEYQWTDSNGVEISIDNPLQNVPTGMYTLIVEDSNGCTIDPTGFFVDEPDELIVSIDISPITCNGGFGELTAIVTGGIEDTYTYIWTDSNGIEISTSNTAGEIIAGEYNVTVTDVNGNSDSLSESLLSIAPIIINETITDVTCFNANDGMIVLDIQGGSGNYDISFDGNSIASNTISGLSGGTYNVTVTDQNDTNCFTTLPITVDEPLQYGLENIIVTTPSPSNNDGSISLDVLGGIPPFTFEWVDQNGNAIITNTDPLSSTLTGLSEGDYTLTVTDSSPFNCTITNVFTLGLPGELLLDIQITNDITCFNGSDGEITVSTNTGVNTYTWFDATSNPPVVIPGLITPVIQVSAGTYIVEVFDAIQDITEISAPITITEPIAIQASVTNTSNPLCFESNDGAITINTLGGNDSYEYIYRLVGTDFPIIWVGFDNANSTTINNLAQGDYEIRVRDGLGCTFNNNDGTIANITASIIAPNELTIDSSIITEPTGNGLSNGSISVNILGGTSPYTYQWTDISVPTNTMTTSSNTISNISTGTYELIVTDSNGCTIDPTIFEVGEPDELIVTTTIEQVILCNDDATGSISATATGGVPLSSTPNDYTFEWFDETNPISIGSTAIIENLPAGTYFVVVTDSTNNVTISDSVEIIEPPLLEVQLNADFVLCGDGNDWTITTTVTGGTGDYNYSWNTGDNTPELTNVIAGEYTISVSDQNGCITTDSITLTPPEPLTAVENITPTTCFDGNDGSIQLTVSGGSPPYEYVWDTGDITDTVNNLASGIYQVSIIDDRGCEIINSYEITEPEEVIIDLGEDLTLCIDQTITLDATIPDESTYTWSSSNGFESTNATVEIGEAGTYTVTAMNTSGCIVTDQIIIETVNNPINAEFLVSTQVFTNEPFVIVQVSEPFPDTVEWILPDDATIIELDEDFAELVFDTPGVYEIGLLISNGSCTDIQTKEVTVVEAEEFDIEVEESDGPIIKNFLTYPNPTNGAFTLDVELKEELPISAKIYSLNSNIPIDTRVFTDNDHYIEPYDLNIPPGVYFLVLEAPNMTTLKKLIIN